MEKIKAVIRKLSYLLNIPTSWLIFLTTVEEVSLLLLMDNSSAQMAKNPPAMAGDLGLIPGSGRTPGEGNGNPLQYSCLENPMDRGA